MLFDQNRVDAIIHNWKNHMFSNERIHGVPLRHSTCLKTPIGGFRNLASRLNSECWERSQIELRDFINIVLFSKAVTAHGFRGLMARLRACESWGCGIDSVILFYSILFLPAQCFVWHFLFPTLNNGCFLYILFYFTKMNCWSHLLIPKRTSV